MVAITQPDRRGATVGIGGSLAHSVGLMLSRDAEEGAGLAGCWHAPGWRRAASAWALTAVSGWGSHGSGLRGRAAGRQRASARSRLAARVSASQPA